MLDVIKTRGIGDTVLNSRHCKVLEEADGRIITHVMDMVKQGFKSVVVRSSDTDVVVLAVSYFHELATSGLKARTLKISSQLE